jgi:CHAD domain-containing protein
MRAFAVNKTAALLNDVVVALHNAATQPEPEAIHQMRVSIRRFQQALRLFADHLDEDGVERVKKQLRAIMEIAGELRNRDIALELAPELTALSEQRAELNQKLAEILQPFANSSLTALWGAKLGLGGLREHLRRQLPKVTRRYFKEGREALAPGATWEAMHAFRLRTKRYRYTLETFRDFYGPGIEKRIEALRKIQTYLGDINDCIVTTTMLESIPGTEDTRAKLAERAAEKTAKLREYWAENFDKPGGELLWTRYLVTYACRNSARTK